MMYKFQSAVHTVLALLQPRGSILQNDFLGGAQFKFDKDLTNFLPKSGFSTGLV